GRAVTNLPDFTGLGINKIKQQTTPATPTNGIICLKGGDLNAEIKTTLKKYSLQPTQITEYKISDFFEEDFFETKKIIKIEV
ncbi:MAG: hypothetical protein LBR10_01030, partial [Prevotellaceae bacterium]|nr:hypothetical protein [Prevotellaceae bacterium]